MNDQVLSDRHHYTRCCWTCDQSFYSGNALFEHLNGQPDHQRDPPNVCLKCLTCFFEINQDEQPISWNRHQVDEHLSNCQLPETNRYLDQSKLNLLHTHLIQTSQNEEIAFLQRAIQQFELRQHEFEQKQMQMQERERMQELMQQQMQQYQQEQYQLELMNMATEGGMMYHECDMINHEGNMIDDGLPYQAFSSMVI